MSRQAVLEQFRNSLPLIAPSLLKCDFGNLEREIALLEAAGAQVLHLDVMDGHFVPNLSYGPVVIERMRELTRLPFDAHLMISDPARYLDDFLAAGCDAITVHIEAVPDPRELLERIREADAVAGLALNPGTPVEAVEPFLADCDLVLVMSVEPGFGGQKFLPGSLEKLRRLRQTIEGSRETPSPGGGEGWGEGGFTEKHPSPLPLSQRERDPEAIESDAMRAETLLSIDGGIGPSTIGETAAAGAKVFVVGSAVFDASDYGEALRELSEIAGGHLVSAPSSVVGSLREPPLTE